MESKELTIVIVTFKSEDRIKNCLKSISNDIPVIVVENSDNENFKKKLKMILIMSNVYYPVKTKDIQLLIILV